MTNGYKESLIIADPADDVESKKQYKLRRRILAETAKLGQISLIMPHGENGYWLDIAVNKGWTNPRLAEVVFYDEITLEELTRRANPWEIMIFEKRETNKKAAIVQIAKELPAFFRSFYPEVEGLPISIYDSRKSFRAKKPFAVVKFSTISFPEVI